MKWLFYIRGSDLRMTDPLLSTTVKSMKKKRRRRTLVRVSEDAKIIDALEVAWLGNVGFVIVEERNSLNFNHQGIGAFSPVSRPRIVSRLDLLKAWLREGENKTIRLMVPRRRTFIVSETAAAVDVAQALREGRGSVLVHAVDSPETIVDVFTEMDFIRFISKNMLNSQLGYFKKLIFETKSLLEISTLCESGVSLLKAVNSIPPQDDFLPIIDSENGKLLAVLNSRELRSLRSDDLINGIITPSTPIIDVLVAINKGNMPRTVIIGNDELTSGAIETMAQADTSSLWLLSEDGRPEFVCRPRDIIEGFLREIEASTPRKPPP